MLWPCTGQSRNTGRMNRAVVCLLWILCPALWLGCRGADCKTIELKVDSLPPYGNLVENAVLQRFLELYPEVRVKKATGLQIEGGSNTMDMVPLMQIAGD